MMVQWGPRSGWEQSSILPPLRLPVIRT